VSPGLRDRSTPSSQHHWLTMTDEKDPTDIDATSDATAPATKESFRRWCNLNSFAAKLSAEGYRPWLSLPIWQLRIALEEQSINWTADPCQLWVATKWLIRCSDVLYQEMISQETIDEETARALRPGELCPADVRPLSLARWTFGSQSWRRRAKGTE